jgi:uncharacterized membrane protein
MQLQSVDVGRAFHWYAAGWHAFIAAPLPWLAMTAANLLIAVLLSRIPYVGNLLLMLVSPFFTAGMLHAARETHAGRPIAVSLLFTAFSKPALRNRLLILAAFTVLSMFLAGAIWVGLLGSAPISPAVVGPRVLIGTLLLLGYATVLTAALFYAVPLLLCTEAGPLEALKTSLHACVLNILSLSVFAFISLILAFLAVLPLALGLLVFLPVWACSVYVSFIDIFEGAA